MYVLYIITGIGLIVSVLKDVKKTVKALKIAWKKLLTIVPAFIMMLIFVSIILYFLPEHVISSILSNGNKYFSLGLASLIGSITLMPGFVAYPLCGLLIKRGVSYMVLSAFTTTLMMVGILTYPVEKEYFGVKVTILRNVLSLFIALIIALITGIAFGEIF